MNPEFSGSVENELGALRARIGAIEEALRRSGVVLELPVIDPPATGQPLAMGQAPPAQEPAGPGSDLGSGSGAADSRAADLAAATWNATGHASTDPILPAGFAEGAAKAAQAPFATPAVDGSSGERSLESRIGSQWFNRIGILAVLIGMAWFLKLAIDNHWIGPLGRVLIGLIAGAGLIAWSERFRGKGYAAFSYSLKALGSGILYLSLWAAFSLFHLLPASAAFAAMILVTAFNGVMAWVQDAELLALYAIVGGLGTPLLVSTGQNQEVALFSYLLVLDVAVLILLMARPWSRLLFMAFLGTAGMVGLWWGGNDTNGLIGRTGFFYACFFLIFALAPRLVRVRGSDGDGKSVGDAPHGWDSLALVVLPIGSASLGFLGFYTLLDRGETEWALPWLAVLFAAFYLLLLRLPARGRLRGSPAALGSLHLAAAVVFLTLAIPLKAQGPWLTIGWLLEGAALLWVAGRVRSALLRVLAVLCLVLGLMALIVAPHAETATPILNERFGTYCVAVATFAFVAWLALRTQARNPEERATGWHVIAPAAVLAVNALILLAVGLEIDSFWRGRDRIPSRAPVQGHVPGVDWAYLEAHRMETHRMYAQFSYSAWFMVFGAILLGVGFKRRSAFLRWQGLVLLAVSVVKVFVVDVSALSQGYRILSFLALGALLLGISFVYQRDWLHLRAGGNESNRGAAETKAQAESRGGQAP